MNAKEADAALLEALAKVRQGRVAFDEVNVALGERGGTFGDYRAGADRYMDLDRAAREAFDRALKAKP